MSPASRLPGRAFAALLLCLQAGLPACRASEHADSGETPAEAGSLRVLERLGPAAFGLPDALRDPVAAIDGVARPVLQAPHERRVGRAFSVAPDPDGRVRASFALEPELAAEPDAGFVLDVQRLPGEMPSAATRKFARSAFVHRLASGWSLAREAGEMHVVYEPDDHDPRRRYNLYLSLQEADRLEVVSQPLRAGPGARLELAFGRNGGVRSADAPAARFAARLACPGEEPVALVEAEVGPSDPPRWHEADAVLPARDGCRLSLSSAGPRGEAVRGALWAAPRIVGPGPPTGEREHGLVLISLDTLRADHLSGYGYPRRTSPRIDAELMARGCVFTDVTTTYSRTNVSHMSLFSGLYPEARPDPGRLQAATPMPLLAERLAAAGYQTAGFAEDGLVSGAFGFWFGFDRFAERSEVGVEGGALTFARAREWLRDHRDRRFFLFVHTYKTHAPYAAREPYEPLFRDPADWEREGMPPVPEAHRAAADEYDRTIREADDLVASLLETLHDLGLEDDTLVVLTSDHGEAFAEHGLLGHSTVSHQEVMHVPLVLRGPGVPEGLRVTTPVSLVDLTPTLLDFLGLPALDLVQGISLVPALRGSPLPEKRPLFFSWMAWGERPGVGVRYEEMKFQRRNDGDLLYDLSVDPGEREPIGKRRQPRPYAERLLSDHEKASAAIREQLSRAGDERSAPALSPGTEEALRALGYVE